MFNNENVCRNPVYWAKNIGVFVALLVIGFSLPLTAAAEPIDCNAEPIATPIIYGEFYDGGNCSISSGDIDVSTFKGTAGERARIVVVDQSGFSSNTVCVTLLDPMGNPTTNGGTTCSNITVIITEDLPVDGVYTITIQETDTGSFTYGVSLERLAPMPSPFSPVVCNGCTNSATIVGGGDNDLHIFTGATGDVVTLQATDLSGFSSNVICLTLYNSTGTSINSVCADITAVHDEVLPADDVYTLLVRENDSGTMSYNVVYQCLVGTCPAFDSPEVAASSMDIDFGPIAISTSSTAVAITLTGTSGDIDAEIGQLALAGVNAGEFSIENDQCTNMGLTHMQTCTFDVVFNPMSIGDLEASIDIPTNDQVAPLLSIALIGEGTNAPLICAFRTVTIQGTPGDDILIGTAGPDVIHGLGGKDVIYGLEGDDRICGGDGRDVLVGGPGDDRLLGQSGPDMLLGGDGNDILKGGSFIDYLNGGAGDDLLDGQLGIDLCDGGVATTSDTATAECETLLNVP